MRRYAFRVAIVVCVLAVSPLAGWSTGLAARSDAFHWSNAKWATFLPTASDLAATFTVPNILFNTPRDFQCRQPTCGPYNILGPGNDVLGAQNAFLDGARMYFFGHEYNGHNLSSGVPAIWIAVALFHDDSEAQLVQRGLDVLPPAEIRSETVTFHPDIGTVPAEDAVIHATSPVFYGGTIEFLSYSQSNLVVEIWMANPDSQTVLRLGREIDQKAIAAGFTR